VGLRLYLGKWVSAVGIATKPPDYSYFDYHREKEFLSSPKHQGGLLGYPDFQSLPPSTEVKNTSTPRKCLHGVDSNTCAFYCIVK
jgi:hypothetical protein